MGGTGTALFGNSRGKPDHDEDVSLPEGPGVRPVQSKGSAQLPIRDLPISGVSWKATRFPGWPYNPDDGPIGKPLERQFLYGPYGCAGFPGKAWTINKGSGKAKCPTAVDWLLPHGRGSGPVRFRGWGKFRR